MGLFFPCFDIQQNRIFQTKHDVSEIIHGSVFQQADFIRFSYANTPEYTQGALDALISGLQELEIAVTIDVNSSMR